MNTHTSTNEANTTSNDCKWWMANFKIDWSESEGRPRSYLDIAITLEVLCPLLAWQEPSLWRIHRRWDAETRDHQFWFEFWSDEPDAKAIFARLDAEFFPLSKRSEWRVKLETPPPKPTFEGIGEEIWNDSIRHSWPYYIHGVSQLWMKMLRSEADHIIYDAQSNPFNKYKAIEESMNRIWHIEAQHAFLHHINVVFGNTPVKVWQQYNFVF